MDNLYDILNINKINKETLIKICIFETKYLLNGLDIEQTCMIYSNYLYQILSKKHVVSKIVSTKYFNYSYDHNFILIPIDTNKYYLCDLTYNHFNNDNFTLLKKHGYQQVNDLELKKYLDIVTNTHKKVLKK